MNTVLLIVSLSVLSLVHQTFGQPPPQRPNYPLQGKPKVDPLLVKHVLRNLYDGGKVPSLDSSDSSSAALPPADIHVPHQAVSSEASDSASSSEQNSSSGSGSGEVPVPGHAQPVPQSVPVAPVPNSGAIPAAPIPNSGAVPVAPVPNSGAVAVPQSEAVPAAPVPQSGGVPAAPVPNSGAIPVPHQPAASAPASSDSSDSADSKSSQANNQAEEALQKLLASPHLQPAVQAAIASAAQQTPARDSDAKSDEVPPVDNVVPSVPAVPAADDHIPQASVLPAQPVEPEDDTDEDLSEVAEPDNEGGAQEPAVASPEVPAQTPTDLEHVAEETVLSDLNKEGSHAIVGHIPDTPEEVDALVSLLDKDGSGSPDPNTLVNEVVEEAKVPEDSLQQEIEGSGHGDHLPALPGVVDLPDCKDEREDCGSLRALCHDDTFGIVLAEKCPMKCGICKLQKEALEALKALKGQECKDTSNMCFVGKPFCKTFIFSLFTGNVCPRTCNRCHELGLPQPEEEPEPIANGDGSAEPPAVPAPAAPLAAADVGSSSSSSSSEEEQQPAQNEGPPSADALPEASPVNPAPVAQPPTAVVAESEKVPAVDNSDLDD